jgi:diaminopimelate decarboxylase
MYSSNRTTARQFAFALKDGGSIINFDDITAMNRVPGKFPEFVCFRINPGKRRTGNSIIGNPYDAKYGITYAQIIPAYREAMRRGAERFGIHMMVCSNERHSSYFVETVRAILEVAALLKEKLGIQVEFINIGGGSESPTSPVIKNSTWTGSAGKPRN